jgi:DNA-binding transcriptional MerR regulator
MPVKDTLTIQEMARQSGLSEHTLRYYERIGLLTPIPRDHSSGHRRYSADMAVIVESLSCLRGTGMSLEDIRRFLHLRQRGNLAAREQKALFAAHLAAVTEEIEQMKVRMEYLADKVAYWTAVEAGDMEEAALARDAARRLMPSLTRRKVTQ